MSLAVAFVDAPDEASPHPDSYEARARLLLVRRPDLFNGSRRGGGFSDRASPRVQSGSEAVRTRRRRGGRQLTLPLAAPAAGMLR